MRSLPETIDRSVMTSDYFRMRVQSINKLHNILASFFTWVLLAGFVVFPSTFTSIQNSKNLQAGAGVIWDITKHVPVIVIAGLSCIVGCCGIVWLGVIHRDNYDWMATHLFLPAFLNSVVGLSAALINVYAAQNGSWSVTAIITVSVIGTCFVISGGLYFIYGVYLLDNVKRDHNDRFIRR